MVNKEDYVLWLPSWYPNKLTPFDGDFIQRHAQAVSLFMPVHVLHLIKDEYKQVTKDILVEERHEGNLKETIIYYTSPRFFWKPIEKFLAIARFGSIYRKFLRNYFKKHDLPSVVHVHVAIKGGLIAKWMRRSYGIPYILTEHWTLYLEESKNRLNDLSFARQYLISQVVSEATKTVTVSHHLGRSMQVKWPFLEYEVIPNVVNKKIFYPAKKNPSSKLKLVHASTLNFQKDPGTLLRACAILKSLGVPFQLDICGPLSQEIKEVVKHEGIENETILHGEVSQSHLADIMREADALVLYSRYETFGCVIIEANACGIPVIVSDIPVMHELILNGVNGLFVPPGDAALLAMRLAEFKGIRESFDSSIITKTTEQFSFETVGALHVDLYNKILYPEEVVNEEA